MEEPTGQGRALVLATGVAAAMMVAVMVIAVTPPRSNAPTAVSVTTLPALTVQLRGSAVQSAEQAPTHRSTETVRIAQSTTNRDNALALVGSPNSVSATPADLEALDVGTRLPAASERVHLLTQSHTYVVRWSQIDRLVAPDGSVLVTVDGELVATFVDGVLRILVD